MKQISNGKLNITNIKMIRDSETNKWVRLDDKIDGVTMQLKFFRLGPQTKPN